MSETTRTLTEAEIELSNCHDLMDQRTSAVGAGYKLARRIVEEFTRLDDEAAAHAQAVQRLTEERDAARALWESVGKHIDATAIGWNHPQIAAVFDRAEQAEAALAALRAQVERLTEALESIASPDDVSRALTPREIATCALHPKKRAWFDESEENR